MYLSYYGLKEKPFDISTDPKFLWLGEKHKEALAVLKYGVLENKGFLLLTGDVGAGKTTLIHALVEGVGHDVIYATIPDPGLELMEFYSYLAKAFNLDQSFSNKSDFIFLFREFLHHAYDNGKRVLLIIDESQRLSNNLLEEIRLLSNIELQNVKLLSIFFVGQVEFNTRLLEPENRAVRQRITISNHIRPLTEKEAGEYIRHRLRVAGCQKNIFSFVAIHEIHKFSRGYPRLINIVCDLSLVSGYVKEVKKIGEDIVRESIESLNIKSHIDLEEPEPSEDNFLEKVSPATAPKTAGRTETVVIKQSGWPKAATVYVCLLLTFAVAYLMYSDQSLNRLKQWVTSTKQSLLEEVDPHAQTNDAAVEAKPGEKAQRGVYPLVNTENSSGKESSLAKPPNAPAARPSENVDTSDFTFEGGRLTIDFKHNSNEFSDDGFKVLEKLSRFLIMNPDVMVLVIGYSDDMGTYSYNINLSSFRANIVKSYLVGKGVAVSRIRATGLGPENPRASNATAEGRRMNRRVEIEIIHKSL